MTGNDIVREAFTDFDNWQKHQDDDLLDRMPIIQQAAHYADDDDWHNRKSDQDYLYRFT